ncbi:MAG: hypothetical protein RLZZ612_174 [Pseudomonadota bacterium]
MGPLFDCPFLLNTPFRIVAPVPTTPAAVTQLARQRFCAQLGSGLPSVTHALKERTIELLDQAYTAREVQSARDTQIALDKGGRMWVDGVRAALQQRLNQRPVPSSAPLLSHTVPGRLELLPTEAVEDQLLASKLALSVQDKIGQEWTDLKTRLVYADRADELSAQEITRPESVARLLVDEWVHAQLGREEWQMLQVTLHKNLTAVLKAAYEETNRFLIHQGVLPVIPTKPLVRKPSAGAAGGMAAVGGSAQGPSSQQGAFGQHASGHGGFSVSQAGGPVMGESRSEGYPVGYGGVNSDMWGRAKGQAQEIMGRLMNVLASRGGVNFAPSSSGHSGSVGTHAPPTRATPALQLLLQPRLPARHKATGPVLTPAERMAQLEKALAGEAITGSNAAGVESQAIDVVIPVEQALTELKQNSAELKKAAETPSEKATIEIVALMFQSILNEDRLPPSLRVWFARLQVPVLRLALAEPDFFSSQHHPARRLIDRMGSCALGFSPDASQVTAPALESEIRRIVQVIEQYPETGRRVFELSFNEFEKFLSKHLQTSGSANELVTIAQQVEQKETLTVQFTIELRKQLDTMTVHDDIRDFFFKVWAEVLAVATVKHGPKHEETSDLKLVAVDLLWAASAKPNRQERSKVIAQLPSLLKRLRKGMSLLGLVTDTQEQHIKVLSNVLSQAFMAKTESIAPEQLQHITRHMSDLEKFLPSNGTGDLELDQDSIEMIIGVDASNIEVISAGGTPPSDHMRVWATQLQLGSWYTLDHNSHVAQVQLAWRSQRGQLYLFTSTVQRYFLIHAVRVASYLQAGLLTPIEEEPLTMRATRAALEKIDANPERLLN